MSRESLFDLISLFCRRLGRQTAEATSRLGSTPHLGLRFPAPPPTHTQPPLLGGLNEKPKGMGVKQRRCRALALQTGLSSCAPSLGHHRPQPTLTPKQEQGRGGGGCPQHPHTQPQCPKATRGKKPLGWELAGALSLWGVRKEGVRCVSPEEAWP